MNLSEHGICLVKDFLGSDQVKSLNNEFDFLCNRLSINGRSGYYLISKNYKTIPLSSIVFRSSNILEIALDIRDVLIIQEPNLKKENLKLTAIQAFEEISSKPLPWHTDNRDGMYRAFIYLEGGSYDSGALRFMLGTHKRNYYVKHMLSKDQIRSLKDKIYIAQGEPGTLVIANTVGFHGNQPRNKKRRILVFEFQQKNQVSKKSSIFISSFQLSERVIKNIQLFNNGVNKEEYFHGDDNYLGNKTMKIPDKIINLILFLWGKLYKNRIYNSQRKAEILIENNK